MHRTTIHEELPTPLGKRLGRFVTLLGVVFTVGVAVVVTQRFSEETLALIVGLLIAGIPLLGLVFVIGVIALKIAIRPRNEPPPQMTIPPIIMQIPQQQNNPWAGWNNGHEDTPMLTGGRRVWEVIGPEGD